MVCAREGAHPIAGSPAQFEHGRQGQKIPLDAEGQRDLRLSPARELDHGLERLVVQPQEAPADLLEQQPARLHGGGADQGCEQPIVRDARVVLEELLAVDGVRVVLLMPLDEIQALALQVHVVLEVHEPEDEVGHVEIEDARVLVGPVRARALGRVQPAALLQGGHARDLQDQPAQLQEQRAGRAFHGRRVGDG